MSALTSMLTLTVTVTHVAHTGAADVYGNPTESTTTSTVNGELQQQRRDEQTTDANVQRGAWLLVLDVVTTAGASFTLDGNDRVTVLGVTYELDGPPWKVRDPETTEYSHWEATVRRAA